MALLTVGGKVLLAGGKPVNVSSGGGANVAMGIITPADMNASQLEITHGLGAIPEFILICAANAGNNVYHASTPNGQSFYYAIRDPNVDGWHLIRQQYSGSSQYNGGNINGTELSSDAKYYLVVNEQTMIWANRNSKYGFGEKTAPFFWLAIKEIPA